MEFYEYETTIYLPVDAWPYIVLGVVLWYIAAMFVIRKWFSKDLPDEGAALAVWVISPILAMFMVICGPPLLLLAKLGEFIKNDNRKS